MVQPNSKERTKTNGDVKMTKGQTIIINAPGETSRKPAEPKSQTVKDVSGHKLRETMRSQEVLLMAEAKRLGVSLSDTFISLFKVCFYAVNVICLMAFMIVRNIVKNSSKGSKKESKESKPFEIKI